MITVKYFASLREALGREHDTVTSDGIASVRDVWEKVAGDAPPPRSLLIAVNREYADWQRAVRDGDEVAFFPPVTGG